MSNKDKKTFYLNKDKEKPITAGGVIIYRFVSGNMELLMADTRGNYEDLGGRCDKVDKDICTTVAREASEESNELLDKRSIKKRLKDEIPIYMPKMKYVVFVIEATKEEAKLVSSDFGDKELHDDIERKIKWIPLDIVQSKEIFKDRLAWRLKSRNLMEKLKSIKSESKITISLFKTPSTNSTQTNSSSSSDSSDDELEEETKPKPAKKSTKNDTNEKEKKVVKKQTNKKVIKDSDDENKSSDEDVKPTKVKKTIKKN